MASTITNEHLEIQAVKAAVSSKNKIRQCLLSELKDYHFSNPSLLRIFKRLRKFYVAKKPITSLRLLREDRTLSSEEKELLGGTSARLKNTSQANQLVKLLNEEYHRRSIYDVITSGISGLEKNKTSEDIFKTLYQELGEARSALTDNYNSTLVGINRRTGVCQNTAGDLVTDLIKRKHRKKKFLKTGFSEFDLRTGGFAKQQLVILASETSGGKSVLALQLGVNFFVHSNKNVCIYSLEMSAEDYWARVLSNISGAEFKQIFNGELSPKTRNMVKKDFKGFYNHARDNNLTFEIRCPNYDISMLDIGSECQDYKFDAIIIDMLTLLRRTQAGGGQLNEASVLSQMAREAKIMAKNLDCVVVVLTQLNDDNRIKYSRGIMEHADFCWTWTRDEQMQTAHLIEIEQTKHRNAPGYNFFLSEHFETMRVLNPGESQKDDIKKTQDNKANRKKGSKRSYNSGPMRMNLTEWGDEV